MKMETSEYVFWRQYENRCNSPAVSLNRHVLTANVTQWWRERERENELWSQNRIPIPALPFPPSENDKWLTPQPQIPGSRTALALSRHSMNHSHFPPFNKYSLNKFTCLVSPCAISYTFPHKYNMKVMLVPIYQSKESEQNSMMTNKLGLKGLKVVQLLRCYLGVSFQLTRDLWTLMGKGRHLRRLLTFR